VINERATDSKPYWPPQVVPPKGAPNVLLITTDDVGFAAPSTFGGVIPAPAPLTRRIIRRRNGSRRSATVSKPFADVP
jgi:hypothetical protein